MIDARILITGGSGFLGKYVAATLRERGYKHIFALGSRDYDLRQPGSVVEMYQATQPHVVIHLAACVGGIGANRDHPAEFFYDNLLMGAHTMHYAWQHGVKKFVAVGTVCAYPKFTPTPFTERDLWNGYPEETNAPYGLAKKMLLVQAQAYRQQYDFNAIYLLPVNLYGPGDNFDPAFSHVIPALIRKCIDANECGDKRVVIWGTGKASREFLYVEDAARAIVLAMEKYDKPDPVNVGSGMEITIQDLVTLITELAGFHGEIIWDASKPDGQPRRCLDTSQAWHEFGFRAQTDFREGLQRTIEWYIANRHLVEKGIGAHDPTG